MSVARILAIIAGTVSLVLSVIATILWMNNMGYTGNLFGHGGIFYHPNLWETILMFLNSPLLTIFGIVGGFALLMPRRAMSKRGKPLPDVSDVKTISKAYKIGGILCLGGGILALAAYELFGTHEGLFFEPLGVFVAGILGLVAGVLPKESPTKPI